VAQVHGLGPGGRPKTRDQGAASAGCRECGERGVRNWERLSLPQPTGRYGRTPQKGRKNDLTHFKRHIMPLVEGQSVFS